MSEEILDKIQKLLRLSKSDNVNEAAQALGLAQKLMEKHNITDVMLTSSKNKLKEEIRDWEDPLWLGNKSRSQWRISLANVLASYNDCRIWLQGPNIHIIGRASSVQTVRYLFTYCQNEIERLSKNYAGNGKGWLNNYKLGAVSAISGNLWKARKEVREEMIAVHGENAKNAIVKVDSNSEEISNWFKNFSEKQGFIKGKGFGSQKVIDSARNTGYRDGQKINVNSGPGLNTGTDKELE